MFYNMFSLFTGIRWNLPFFHQFPAVCKQTKFAARAPDIYAKTILLHVFPLPAASDRLLPRQTPPFFFVLIIGQIHTVEQLHILALFFHICSSLYLSNLRAP